MSKVFVGNLNSNQATEADLRALFEKCGKVTSVVIKLGFGFIDYVDEASAEEAVRTLHMHNYLGKDIRVTRAHSDQDRVRSKIERDDRRRDDPTVPRCRSLFVGNIVPDTTIDKLTDFFEQFGRVDNIKVLPQRNGNTGISAFVDFVTEDGAARAMAKRLTYEGRDLRTDFSNRRGVNDGNRRSPLRARTVPHDPPRSDSYDSARSTKEYDTTRSRAHSYEERRPRDDTYDDRRPRDTTFDDRRPRDNTYDDRRQRDPTYDDRRARDTHYDDRRPRDTTFDDRRPREAGYDDRRTRDTVHEDRRPRDPAYDDRRPRDTVHDDRRPRDPAYDDRRPRDPAYDDRRPRAVSYEERRPYADAQDDRRPREDATDQRRLRSPRRRSPSPRRRSPSPRRREPSPRRRSASPGRAPRSRGLLSRPPSPRARDTPPRDRLRDRW
ncbi:hypothetical protein ACHHYP_13165 [Achlya hypogyna]|uniref:RRM domain-containing protein n=1 Tax=Achlya hypogyna TaxID=1202772 RepID=A0A1V9ZFW0_ACHHY|nr:hypothetical protein ACHHYP_13165 [Achlya hypogyna]